MDETALIDSMPNLSTVPIEESHIIEIDSFCPVSQNPQKGSYIKITYTPKDLFLEVDSLHNFIQSYKNGKWIRDTFVRDMEQTVQTIAHECFNTVHAHVTVYAYLILHNQKMEITAHGF